MAKVRAYELAKELGVETKAVMAQLEEWGEFVRSASSTIEAPVVRKLKEAFAARAPGQGQPPYKQGQPRPAAARPDLSGARPTEQGGRQGQVPAGLLPIDRGTPGGAAPLPPPPLSRPGGPAVRSGAPSPGPNPFSSATSGLGQWARPAEIRSPSHPGTGTKSLSDSATPGKPPAGPIHELVENWNLAERLAPDRSLVVRFLADQSKLATFDIDRVRRVRNQCSHPADLGWPQQYDFDMALTTARELRRRLEADGH